MPIALLFPGQGSQRVGMGADVHQRSASARAVLARAEALSGLPITALCFDGPDDRLRSTEVAQPALVAVQLALLAALGDLVGAPDPADPSGRGLVEAAARLGTGWVAGHSLGEYAACVAAGALSLDDGLKLAAARGRLMARAPAGAMAAVLGLDAERVDALCRQIDAGAVVANDNAPGQIVISGPSDAVARVGEAARAAGAARVIPLNVGGAFHSPLMAEAAREFEAEIDRAEVRTPRWPVIGNTTARPLDSVAALRAELRTQIAAPVRWRESVLWLASAGAASAVECGPGNVLAGLARRTAPGLAVRPLGTAADAEALAAAGQPAPDAGGPR